MESLRDEVFVENFSEALHVETFELRDSEKPLQQSMIRDPRVLNRSLLLFIERTNEGELAPSNIQIPGNQSKAVGTGIEVHVEVLAVVEEPVVTRNQAVDRNKTRNFVEIEILGGASGKIVVGGLGQELGRFNDSPFLGRIQGQLWIIGVLVQRPIFAEVFEQIVRHGLKQPHRVRAKPILGEHAIDIFNHHIEPQRPGVPKFLHAEGHMTKSGSRSGNSGRPK